ATTPSTRRPRLALAGAGAAVAAGGEAVWARGAWAAPASAARTRIAARRLIGSPCGGLGAKKWPARSQKLDGRQDSGPLYGLATPPGRRSSAGTANRSSNHRRPPGP